MTMGMSMSGAAQADELVAAVGVVVRIGLELVVVEIDLGVKAFEWELELADGELVDVPRLDELVVHQSVLLLWLLNQRPDERVLEEVALAQAADGLVDEVIEGLEAVGGAEVALAEAVDGVVEGAVERWAGAFTALDAPGGQGAERWRVEGGVVGALDGAPQDERESGVVEWILVLTLRRVGAGEWCPGSRCRSRSHRAHRCGRACSSATVSAGGRRAGRCWGCLRRRSHWTASCGATGRTSRSSSKEALSSKKSCTSVLLGES